MQINVKIEPRTVLVMFSGGLDSLGALHTVLTDEKFADLPVHCHHVNLVNIENRAPAEKVAVRNIRKWYAVNGYRPFTYSESTFQYPCYNSVFLFDNDVTNFAAGNIVSGAKGNVKYVVYGVTKSDIADSNLEKRRVRSTKIFNAFNDLECPAEKIQPVKHMSKCEIYNFLPEELARLSWSCRTPINPHSNHPMPCGQCHTCEELVGIGHY